MKKVAANSKFSIYQFDKGEGYLKKNTQYGVIDRLSEQRLKTVSTVDLEMEFKTLAEAKSYIYLWS